MVPYILATAVAIVVVNAIAPDRWPRAKRIVYTVVVGLIFSLAIGWYWLTTGDKPDETLFKIAMCPFFPTAEKCKQPGNETAAADLRQRTDVATEVAKAFEAERARQKRQEDSRTADSNALRKNTDEAKEAADAAAATAARIRGEDEARKKAATDAEAARKRQQVANAIAPPAPATVPHAQKTKLYVVTYAPNGELKGPPYTDGTIHRDYSGYAGTLLRDDRGTFEIRVTDVKRGALGQLQNECTGQKSLASIRVGDVVRMNPQRCTAMTDYFVPGAAFAP